MTTDDWVPSRNLTKDQRQLAACDRIAHGTSRVNYPDKDPYYRRLQDNTQEIVFFKFFTNPGADILAVLQSEEMALRGLQEMNSDTYGHIWVLPLTKEGLTTADSLDFKLMKLFNDKRTSDRSK